MTDPIRIQRKRTKGWKMPENTVFVGRGSRFGNPWRIGEWKPINLLADGEKNHVLNRREVIELYKSQNLPSLPVHSLKGKNLACWCKIGEPCHADYLLKIANEGA
jgi:hypothetical protein